MDLKQKLKAYEIIKSQSQRKQPTVQPKSYNQIEKLTIQSQQTQVKVHHRRVAKDVLIVDRKVTKVESVPIKAKDRDASTATILDICRKNVKRRNLERQVKRNQFVWLVKLHHQRKVMCTYDAKRIRFLQWLILGVGLH